MSTQVRPEKTFSVLFLAADPTDASRLRLGEEFREIKGKLRQARFRDSFRLELPQLSVRPEDISQALLDEQPNIVHFSGHGTSSGALCFENQTGQSQLVQPDALAALFEQFSTQVNCVLLNACHSDTQARAIAEHVEYVIGMNQAIGDKAAIAFAVGFYQALGAGSTIEEAYKLGCVQIRLNGIPEHQTPVLVRCNSSKIIKTDVDKKYQPHRELRGKQHNDLLHFFTSDWMVNGPPVAILQGFSGCGKTQLARLISEASGRPTLRLLPQSDAPNPATDFLTDLPGLLKDVGILDLVQEMDKGAHGDLLKALLRVLRRERILLVIDEFQRLFNDTETIPPKQWQQLVEELNSCPNPNGRLLIISNRTITPALWCESCTSVKLDGLTDTEAAAYFLELLDAAKLIAKVPTKRVTEIGHRLGGNPRALKTLVGSLVYDSLDELISLAPDLFKPGDVELNHNLVEQFERELIERAFPQMSGDLVKFFRFLAVHRRPFTKEVYAGFANTSPSAETLRKQLIDRYLLENTPSCDTLHPLAREINVSRLRTEKEEWRQAHSLAADYHFRHFKAVQPKGTQRLTASYAELRHHLLEAGRIAELHHANYKLTKFALSHITKPVQSQVPHNIETLEERIALISALPDDHRPKGLEFHLALCLKHRNIGDDYKNALFHARRAVWSEAYYAAWLLLIELEYNLNGIDAMLRAQNEALKHLGGGSNSFSVYLLCAQLLEKNDRLSEAIEVLEKGIYTPGVTCLSSLIGHCARYMEQASRFDDAIRILQMGINTPNMPELGQLYLRCANAMARANRQGEALALLRKGVKTRGITKLYSIYLKMADYLVNEGQDEAAINCLKEGIADSRVLDPKEIYCHCAELLVKNQRIGEAATILEQGIESKAVKDPVPLYHSYVGIMEKIDNTEGGVKFLKKAMANPRMAKEPSLYLTCAKLMARARNLDDAIGVLNQGLLVPGMKGKNHFYQMKAEMTVWQGRLDEAIDILEKGIANNDPHHLDFLYKYCSELMEKAKRLNDAIALLMRGINSPGLTNKGVIYQLCAKLLAKADRAAEGVELLEKAIRLPGMPGMVMLYQTCTDLMSSVGRTQDAIKLLNGAISGPRMGNLASLYMRCADLLVFEGRREEAVSLLKKGIADYPGDGQVKSAYYKVVNPE